MALLCGWDPIAYAAQDGVERLFSDAVLERANRYRAEEIQRITEAVGAQVGNRVAELLAAALR